MAIIDDTRDEEDDETFTVMLSDARGAGAGIGTRSATATIRDNDMPVMSIANATAKEENGGTITFDVSLSLASDLVITATYTTSNGSATAGSDFNAASGTVMFPAGAQSAAITIALMNDSTAESAETFTVTLSSPSSTASLGDATATGTIEDDDLSFTLDIAGGGTVVEGGSATFTVTLTPSPPSATPTEEITVRWATANGSATEPSDYTAGSGTLRFVAEASGGDLTKQFTVETTDDTRDEEAEDFTVTLSSASGASARIGTDTATATITDNDVPVMSIANATADENGGTITFEVSLSLASDLPITATYATGNGTAFAGMDFTAPTAGSNTVRFSPGTTTAQIAIVLIDDTANESTETFTVTLSGPSSSATLGTATATGTIEDDDVTFTFAIAGGGTVAEGGSATFTVSLTPLPATATPGELTVDWATEDGTAAAGSDYNLGSGTLRFAAGSTASQQLMVTILDDELDELSEQFSVRLSNETGAGARIGGKAATAEATITDNDEPVLSIADVTAQEDAGSIVFPVALSLPSALEITASYATTAGTATAGQDFTAKTGTVRVTAGATAATIAIDVLEDDADEPNETFTVTLSNPSATAALAADPSATGTITDNDGPPALSIDDATAEEGETSMVFTARLDKASGSEVTASWSTADDTASAPADYTAVTGRSITISAGSLTTELTVTLNVVDNELDEPDKQFSVTLASLANADPGDLTATGTIADDDLPKVSLLAGSAIVEGSNAQFELTRDGNLVVPLEVRLTVTQVGDFIAGTAPTSASFDANADTLVVAVPTADDDVDEAAGSITLTLTVQPGATYATVGPASAAVTVADNDLPTLTVAAVDTEVIEGGSARFRVTRAGNDHDAALDFEVFAAPSAGYFVEASSVDGTIEAGNSSADVSVAIEDNFVDGEVGELTVAMGTSTAYHAGTPAQVTIPIRDDDEAGATPRLSVLDRPCFENTDIQPCIVLLQLDRAATAAFTVRMNTADGTAQGGADFRHVRGERVRFAIGDVDYLLDPLVLTGDGTDEEDETFSVIVTLAVGTDPAAVTIAKGTGTVTIRDDDPPASVSLDDASAVEGDDSIGFVASLNSESGKVITLAWTATDGSATTPADYTERTGTVTFAAGATRRTIAVPLQNDAVTESTETFQLTLSRTGTTGTDDVKLEDATATGTITDDDAVLSLTVNPTTISENEQATVTVSADAAPSAPLTISLVVTGGTAAAGDYTITPASITIEANTTSGSATVTAVNDNLVEGDEEIKLSARLGATEIDSASIIITQNDPASWNLTVSPDTVTEGQPVTVTAKTGDVTFATDQTITLTLTGSATAPDDYTIAPASITITAGATSGTATVDGGGGKRDDLDRGQPGHPRGQRHGDLQPGGRRAHHHRTGSRQRDGDGEHRHRRDRDDHADARRQRDGAGRLHDRACEHHDQAGATAGTATVAGGRQRDDRDRPGRDRDRERAEDRHHGRRRRELQPGGR